MRTSAKAETKPADVVPPWVDAEEVAACLGTTPHTLRRLAREGHSPVVVRRVGGRRRWSRADLQRFVSGDDDAAGRPH